MKVTFNGYMARLLHKNHETTGLTGDASAELAHIVQIIISKIMSNVNILMRNSSRKTISNTEIASATKILFPPGLGQEAIKAGNEAVKTYSERDDTEGKSRLKSASSGLILPVPRTESFMMAKALASRKTKYSSIFLTGVVELVMDTLLTSAGNITVEHNLRRLTVEHVRAAIDQNADLRILFRGTIISGGIREHIRLAPKVKAAPRAAAKGKATAAKAAAGTKVAPKAGTKAKPVPKAAAPKPAAKTAVVKKTTRVAKPKVTIQE